MKKNFYLIGIFAFILSLSSCSEATISELTDDSTIGSTERGISSIESQFYDTSSGIASVKTIGTLENGKVVSSSSYEGGILTQRTELEYGSNGLFSAIRYFDGNNAPLLNQDYSVLYDDQDRVTRVTSQYSITEYSYNTNNTIKALITILSTQQEQEATFVLNEDGKILNFNNSEGHSIEFTYAEGRPVKAVVDHGGFGFEVDYGYDDTAHSKGYSSHDYYTKMYGSGINASLISKRPLENMFSLFSVEENTSLVRYFIPSQNVEVRSDFMYVRDAENYVTGYDLIADGSLYCRVSVTYED